MKLVHVVVFCTCTTLLCLLSLYYYSVYDYEKHMSTVPRTYSSYDPLTECVTPFGQLLGVADNVPAYSNCNTQFASTYINYVNLMDPMDNGRRGDPSETRVIMTAYRYSTFDYYMRWLVWNNGLLPRLVENTNQLWNTVDYFNPAKPEQDWSAVYIDNYEKVTSIEERKFNAPRRADAIIYPVDAKTIPTGHIAVVVKVEDDVEAAGDPEKLKELKKLRLHPRRVYVAEQNLRNRPWDGQNYSRVLQFKWRPGETTTHEGYYVDPDGLHIVGTMRVGKAKPLREVPDMYNAALHTEDNGDL
ncbi:hypothetical protein JKF63_04687 [Porcisia hertigi]|uniref:Peptidase C51 domain-containing protein n=1 Tax=Porcisia hertigi TaxID=2761500 RepID=A0A836I4R6_9TRYP|nr:hypothetical protein JKF63_04687 [Porcisia hertigi]